MLIHLSRLYRLYSFALCLAKHLTKSIYQKKTMRLFCLYSSCYFGVRKVQLWILLKIVLHWNIQIEMWERLKNITFWRSLFPVRPRPSYPQRPLGSDQSPPRDVHRPETDVRLGIPTKNIGGRDFVVRTGDGGMGWGGRSGSRQRAGGIQGHCPPVTAKKGFSNVFREIDQTFNCCLVLLWHLCPFGDILWEHCFSPVRTYVD